MSRRALARLAVIAAAYIVAGKVGLSLAFLNASASPVWAPSGIAIAAFVLFGRAVWPAIFVAAFVVNVTTTGSPATSLVIALGNTLEGLVGAWLIVTFCNGARAFERVQDVFRFALAALVAPVVSASVGVAALSVGGFVDPASYSEVWGTWWLGDVSGALVVAPLLITWLTAAPPFPRRASVAETLAFAAIVLLVGAVLFTDVFAVSSSHAPIGFLALPVFAWAAYRFGARGASLSVAVLGAIGSWGTLRGYGPFVREGTNESLVLLQSFMAVAALTSLALAAADLERRRADDALRVGEERKVQERDEFLGVAAHELRTPITSLQLSVQFLLRQIERGFSPGSVELSRALMTVGDQSTKLTRLVSQLLDNVRLDADRLQIERQPVDVAALVTSVVEEVRRITGRADIHLVTAPAAANVDPLRLEQVVRNLLDNAVKFSPQGGDIEVRAGTSGPGHVAIVVRDHGVGVPPERRPGLFQRYQHMEGSPGGLGLGLYVSRQIVEVTLPVAMSAPEVVAAGS